jgi:mRNA-degrading endonuclease RelE of RelBE toxin-antitoxin system
VTYRIEDSPEAVEHLRQLTTRQQATVLDVVEQQLLHKPTVAARDRKRMRANPLAPWELRIGHLRVYHVVETKPEPRVLVRAVGVKDCNRVRIGREVIEL